MVTSEKEMIRKLTDSPVAAALEPSPFTSLQPTYEDSVPPDPEHDWDPEQD